MTETTSMAEQPTSPAEHGGAPLDRLSALAMAYLALPLVLFFAGWLKLPFAIVATLALAAGGVLTWRLCHAGVAARLGRAHLVLLGVAIAWAAWGGAGHFLYANRWDWSLRDAVLRDLTVAAWPPGYDIGGADLWMLRCPLGYFLPAALGGKLLGLKVADPLLWAWTVLGVWAFLSLLPIDGRRVGRAALAVLIVVLFSGMDILGWWTLQEVNPPSSKHMEWWAVAFQYSANTTLLFWSPNHALPAWIAAALFWRHWRTDGFLTVAPLLLALLPIWSPFSMLGMLPFYGLLLMRLVRENKWRSLSLPLLAISLLVVVVVGAYLSTDIGGIPSDYILNRVELGVFVRIYSLFVLFEFGLLCGLVWALGRMHLLLITVAVLLVLPFVRFGPGNDLAMRGSIPALTFLCIATVATLQRRGSEPRASVVICWLMLLLGAVTPLHEFSRAWKLPAWKPDPTVTVMNHELAPPPHYVARVAPTWRRALFRDLGEVLKTTLANQPLHFLPDEIP